MRSYIVLLIGLVTLDCKTRPFVAASSRFDRTTTMSSKRHSARAGQPDPFIARLVLEGASEQLGISEASMTVFADSLCLQSSYLPTTLLTSIVTYTTGRVPEKAVVATILRSRNVVRFKCPEYKDDEYFQFFGCRLLFTFHVSRVVAPLTKGTYISVQHQDRALLKTKVYMESDFSIRVGRALRQSYDGVQLPPQHWRCLKLSDVVLLPLTNPFAKRDKTSEKGAGTLVRPGEKHKAVGIFLEFSPSILGNMSGVSPIIKVTITGWRKNDSLFSVDSGSVKCIIPVQSYIPRASAFLDVFTSGTWILTVISIVVVSFLVTFPQSTAALKLMICLAISTLTAYEIERPPQMRRHSIPRFVLLAVMNCLLQIIVVNLYKNEMTSAFSQVEISTEIRKMVRSHEQSHRGALYFGTRINEEFFTRPYYARDANFIREQFHASLESKFPYCDANVNSLLLHFYIPVATYHKTPVFSKIKDRPESPLLWTKTVDTLLTYSLISPRTPYYLRNADGQGLKLYTRQLSGLDKAFNLLNSTTWNASRTLLREVYDAAFDLRGGEVLSIGEALIMIQILSLLWVMSCLCCFVERWIRCRFQALLMQVLLAVSVTKIRTAVSVKVRLDHMIGKCSAYDYGR